MDTQNQESDMRMRLLQEQNEKLDRILRLLEQNTGTPLQPEQRQELYIDASDFGKVLQSETAQTLSELQNPLKQQTLSELQNPLRQQNLSADVLQRAAYEEHRRREAMERNRRDASFASPVTNEQSAKTTPLNPGSIETRIGTIVVGAVGVILILAALTVLGINYMNENLQGILLFAGAILVTVIGELPLRKHLPKFSLAITSLGISAMFLAIILNYFYLLKLPGSIAIALTIVVTAVSVFLSIRNESAVIRCIALIGGYACMFPLQEEIGTMQMTLVIAVVSIIGLGHLFVPLKENNAVADIITDILNLIVFFRLVGYADLPGKGDFTAEAVLVLVFGCITVLMAGILFLCGIRRSRRMGEEKISGMNIGNMIVMLLTNLIVISMMTNIGSGFAFLPFIAINLVLFILSRKCSCCWSFYPGMWVAAYLSLGFLLEDIDGTELCTCVSWITLVLLTWIISRFTESRFLQIWRTIVTGISVILFLFMDELGYSAVFMLIYLLVSFVPERESRGYARELSVIGRYRTLFVLFFFVYRWLDWINDRAGEIIFQKRGFAGAYILIMTIIAAAFIMITTLVRRFQYKGTRIANVIILFIVLFLNLFSSLSGKIMFIPVFLIGSAVFLFLWKEPYVRVTKAKPVLYCCYVTWMYIAAQHVFDIETAIVSTIGLMVIALLGILYGCVKSCRSLRIYGLGLSMVVCFKLIFYDLSELSLLLRIVLFLSVGILALAISYIYSKTEKKAEQKQIMQTYTDTETADSETGDTENTDSETGETETAESETGDTENAESETAETENAEPENIETEGTEQRNIEPESKR